MRAIILAGGKGTRLRPYTTVLPKPLMPVDGMSILEVVIQQLKRHGFRHVTITVNHLAEIIMAFFGDGGKWGIKIDYSMEDRPLGTIGPLTLIRDLPENFLMMNGDILTDFHYSDMGAHHIHEGNLFTVATVRRKSVVDFGVLHFDEARRLKKFEEKPVFHFDVSAGIYMLQKKVLEYVPAQQPFGFDDLMHRLLAERLPVGVYPFEGIWLDIGRPDDYDRANEEFSSMRERFLPAT